MEMSETGIEQKVGVSSSIIRDGSDGSVSNSEKSDHLQAKSQPMLDGFPRV